MPILSIFLPNIFAVVAIDFRRYVSFLTASAIDDSYFIGLTGSGLVKVDAPDITSMLAYSLFDGRLLCQDIYIDASHDIFKCIFCYLLCFTKHYYCRHIFQPTCVAKSAASFQVNKRREYKFHFTISYDTILKPISIHISSYAL